MQNELTAEKLEKPKNSGAEENIVQLVFGGILLNKVIIILCKIGTLVRP
jgi:hypothetical protein